MRGLFSKAVICCNVGGVYKQVEVLRRKDYAHFGEWLRVARERRAALQVSKPENTWIIVLTKKEPKVPEFTKEVKSNG